MEKNREKNNNKSTIRVITENSGRRNHYYLRILILAVATEISPHAEPKIIKTYARNFSVTELLLIIINSLYLGARERGRVTLL